MKRIKNKYEILCKIGMMQKATRKAFLWEREKKKVVSVEDFNDKEIDWEKLYSPGKENRSDKFVWFGQENFHYQHVKVHTIVRVADAPSILSVSFEHSNSKQ